MKQLIIAASVLAVAGAALAQSVSVPMAPTDGNGIPNPPPSITGPQAKSAPVTPPAGALPVLPSAQPTQTAADAPTPPVAPQGGSVLMLRGLDKITGRPTNITAPIGRPVTFATLTITARFCYSTPPSETPETTAFVQIEDHRAEQGARKVFSGWMYGSSPGLNALEHPLYDVWVISCNNTVPTAVAANTGNTVAKVKAPDSSDKGSTIEALPEGAGQ